MSNAERTEVTKSKISFSRLFTNNYQKQGSKTLEIKQEIRTTSFYPSKKFDSNLQDSLFSNSEFDGTEEKEYSVTETRVAWLLVPAEKTESEVKQMINALSSEACIYKYLSNQPILDDNQLNAISNGLRTKDQFAMSQIVRYPDNHANANELILDPNGNIQYRRTFFSKTSKEDIDTRGSGDVYIPEEIAHEINGASSIAGQTV